MVLWIKVALGLSFFITLIIMISISEEKERRRIDKIKGCTCPKSFWNEIDFDCPVHSPFYTRSYRTIDNKIAFDRIPAKFGERKFLCESCLKQEMPPGYSLVWPKETTRCCECGRVENCVDIPVRDIQWWRECREARKIAKI